MPTDSLLAVITQAIEVFSRNQARGAEAYGEDTISSEEAMKLSKEMQNFYQTWETMIFPSPRGKTFEDFLALCLNENDFYFFLRDYIPIPLHEQFNQFAKLAGQYAQLVSKAA
ncbi:MAG TPA: hypothetical protein PLM16_02500 [Candidatus Woesebacteria bacterium]|nr:hypothetical protein [Candidatus Woesebacteria bacterium]